MLVLRDDFDVPLLVIARVNGGYALGNIPYVEALARVTGVKL
jgi:hypothetical protein